MNDYKGAFFTSAFHPTSLKVVRDWLDSVQGPNKIKAILHPDHRISLESDSPLPTVVSDDSGVVQDLNFIVELKRMLLPKETVVLVAESIEGSFINTFATIQPAQGPMRHLELFDLLRASTKRRKNIHW